MERFLRISVPHRGMEHTLQPIRRSVLLHLYYRILSYFIRACLLHFSPNRPHQQASVLRTQLSITSYNYSFTPYHVILFIITGDHVVLYCMILLYFQMLAPTKSLLPCLQPRWVGHDTILRNTSRRLFFKNILYKNIYIYM